MRISALLRPADKGKGKLGDWTVEYSALAEKSYYLNRKTGESFWSMPPQVMFYIPPKLEDKVFDFGDLEEFQQYFRYASQINVNYPAVDQITHTYSSPKDLTTSILLGPYRLFVHFHD
ncbi:hypothetical protein B484DRAFT_141545 [Ochromonadaceae sp. CCMP2298]|nr:hypothetical protein B484DRAFT_141545 [Ochromonadaceae sp. CCMP2298]